MIQFFVYMASMVILCIIIEGMDLRGTKGYIADKDHYTVRIPAMLKRVYFVLFMMGVLLFFIFLFFWIAGNPSITKGNFITALVICAIGMFVMMFASKWHIVVNNDIFTVYRLFGKPVTMHFQDIDSVAEGPKGQIEIYKGGRKIVTIDLLSDNYDQFLNSLSAYGKLSVHQR